MPRPDLCTIGQRPLPPARPKGGRRRVPPPLPDVHSRYATPVLLAAVIALVSACGAPSPTPTPVLPTFTPTPTDTPTATPSPTATSTPTPGAVVDAPSLNLRAGPLTRHPVVGVAHLGDHLEVTGHDPGSPWLQVRDAAKLDAWAHSDFLTVHADLERVPAAPTPSPPPLPTATPEPMDPGLPFVLAPPAAPPGGAIRLRVRAPEGSQVIASSGTSTVPLFPVANELFEGFLGVELGAPVGELPITATVVEPDGNPVPHEAVLRVTPANYPTRTIGLSGAATELLDPTLRDAELARLLAIWREATPAVGWSGSWVLPVASTLTAPFGEIRRYEPGNVPGRHTGADLRGQTGTPLRAAAAGRVALAELLTVRGNTVVLDHGWGVYTAYFHLSAVAVAPGDQVTPGQHIGDIGATGMVTGPHLHWELRVLGVAVDPLPWVESGPP